MDTTEIFRPKNMAKKPIIIAAYAGLFAAPAYAAWALLVKDLLPPSAGAAPPRPPPCRGHHRGAGPDDRCARHGTFLSTRA